MGDYREGQWWLKELDALVEGGTSDQRRAVAVVRKMIAEQHQGEPVALPARHDIPHREEFESADQYAAALIEAKSWNACLDEIAKRGPLYSRPVQGKPYGWAHDGGKEFTTHEDYASDLQKEGIEMTPLYTHADPGEVERLRAEVAKFRGYCVDLDSEKRELEHKMDAYKGAAQEAATMRAQLTQAQNKRLAAEHELLDAKVSLAEQDALLNRTVQAWAAADTINDMDDTMAALRDALSASAKPSLPKCECDMRTKLVGDGCAVCNTERAAGLAEPSALVERDERADFNAWLHETVSVSATDGRTNKVQRMDYLTRTEEEQAWEAWQARAALERKP